MERLRRAPRAVASLDAELTGSDTTHAPVALLPPRTRTVIALRYGLDRGDALTHEQIGRSLGLTAERCRQIEAEGLRRLVC